MTLPNGWESGVLADVARWGSGGTPSAGAQRFYGGAIPWAVIGDLNDGVVTATRSTITDEGLSNSSAKWVPQDSVLIAMYGSIGKLGLAGRDLTTNQAIAFAIPNERVTSKFLFYFLLHERERLVAAGRGGTQRNISQSVLKPWAIRYPPVDEQRRIVNVLEDHLSRLDAAASGLKLAAERARAFERSVLARCRDGSVVPLSDVAEIQGGIQKQAKRAPRSNAYPFLRVANVVSKGLDLGEVHEVELFAGELDRLRLRCGDLLVVEGNGSPSQIGRAAMWDGSIEDCVHQNHLIRVRPRDPLLPGYLEAVWNSPQHRATLTRVSSSSSGLHTLSVSKLKSLPIPVPSMERQRELVSVVDQARAVRLRLETRLRAATDRGTALRRSLLEAAFSGSLTGSNT